MNSHIREAIEQALFEQVLSTIRETLSELGNSARNNLDSASTERHRGPEVTHPEKKLGKASLNWEEISVIRIMTIKENSFEPQGSDGDYDLVIGANLPLLLFMNSLLDDPCTPEKPTPPRQYRIATCWTISAGGHSRKRIFCPIYRLGEVLVGMYDN